MDIPVKVDVFEGPMDLLLHLIDKNKINIYDIPIAEITDQYLDYIRAMEKKDMEIMSEFLVMAATLLNIKSRMLLPREEKLAETEEDPRSQLVERLLEYKMYKYFSYELKDLQIDASKVMYRKKQIPDEILEYREEVNMEELLSGLTLTKLHEIFKSIIKKQTDKIDPIRSSFGKIEKEEISLTDQIIFIEQYARQHNSFLFRNLLSRSDRMELIITFLGILEMMKMGRIQICQEQAFDDIRIKYCAQNLKPIGELLAE